MSSGESPTSLGDLIRTCRSEARHGVGTPGTYGYRKVTFMCTLPAGHPGDSHLCDEGDVLSSWNADGWTMFRQAKREVTT